MQRVPAEEIGINRMPTPKEKYSQAIRYLDQNFAYFVTHVLNIGRPIYTDHIPTACVMVEKEVADKGHVGDEFSFAFNYDFADELDVEDFAFILSHETMHILLDHLNLAGRFPDKIRFNIAADCVINDYLIDAGVTPSDNLMNTLMSGIKNVGYNCAHATVGQVYDDLPQDIVDQMGEGMSLDDHTWIHMPDELAKNILDKISDGSIIPVDLQDIKDDINSKSDIKMKKAGGGQADIQKFVEVHGVSMNWVNLLKEINPDIFKLNKGKMPRPTYHKRPRKLGAFPDTILPIKQTGNQKRHGDKPVIFMALDTSGSIGHNTARKFITLARSIPRSEIHLEVVTFTSSVMPLDLDNPRFRSGGTAFSPIEEYIRSTVMPKYKNKYPSSVVIITDGDAWFDGISPEKQNVDKWMWLLEPYYRDPRHLFGKIKRLNDFIK